VLTQLPIKLEGTLVHANPKKSIATIMIQAKNQAQSFMVDDDMENLGKIIRVERRKVIFRNSSNQRLEFVEIPKDSALVFGSKAPAAPGGDPVTRAGEFDFNVSRAEVEKQLSNLPAVLNQARMVPNIVPGTGGKVEGFRFVSIQPGSVYEKLGFKPMDVIKTVQGEPVNSPTKAMELYNALRTENQIKITINRNGRDESLNYNVGK
jgi:general secretion pathway protein C